MSEQRTTTFQFQNIRGGGGTLDIDHNEAIIFAECFHRLVLLQKVLQNLIHRLVLSMAQMEKFLVFFLHQSSFYPLLTSCTTNQYSVVQTTQSLTSLVARICLTYTTNLFIV